MNLKLFLIINNAAGHWTLLDKVMIFSAEYLMWVMVAALIVFIIADFKRWRDMIYVAVGSAVVARGLVAEIIKRLYYHARPYWTVAETHLILLPKETQSSFPSGHTIFVFALATGVYLYNKKWGSWYYLLACLVGFARIFVGVHWPYDIVAGAVLGILTALVCDWMYRKYKHIIGL